MSTSCSGSYTSSDSDLFIPHHENYPRGTFSKRCHPQQEATNLPVKYSPTPDHDALHRGKRRRRNNSLTAVNADQNLEPLSWPRQCENRQKTKQGARFPTTSSEFKFSSSASTSTGNTRRFQKFESKEQPETNGETLPDLVRLRSSAFWDLRQSVAENGEGLVRRMRDYERSRSRHPNQQKAKEAEKRGRKRAPRQKKSCSNASASDEFDEDVILISSGDPLGYIHWGSFLGKRSRSLDTMEIDGQQTEWPPVQHTRSQSSGPTSDILYTSGSHRSDSDEEGPSSQDGAMYTDDSFTDPNMEPTPSLANSAYESSNSSLLSLALPPSSPVPDSSLPSTANEKAIAALSLALSNGAGSITDYSSIWKYQAQFNLEDGQNHGELWH